MYCLDNNIYYDNKIVKIEAITKEMISVSGIEANRYTPIDREDKLISHIPISEILLQKVGFNKLDYGHDTYTWFMDNFKIESRPTELYLNNGSYFDTDLEKRQYFLENHRKVNYIHTLQNIAKVYYGLSIIIR